MKQTAVEWLTVEAMKLFTQAITGTLNIDTLEDDVSTIITKAKEMEKEQMEKTWVAGLYCETGDRQAFIDYYNENYKSE